MNRPKRRRFRLSLREILVVTALLAAGLAVGMAKIGKLFPGGS